MTEKELHKLSRSELLELLLDQRKENDRLETEIASLDAKLEDRRLQIEDSQSLADAALKLTKVYADADEAAKLYKDNAKLLEDKAKAKLENANREAEALLADANNKAKKLLADANSEAKRVIARAQEEAEMTRAQAVSEANKILIETRLKTEEILRTVSQRKAEEDAEKEGKQKEKCEKKRKSLLARRSRN